MSHDRFQTMGAHQNFVLYYKLRFGWGDQGWVDGSCVQGVGYGLGCLMGMHYPEVKTLALSILDQDI